MKFLIIDNKFCELKNGKGHVKEYDDYGNIKFEGEYLNGKRNGKGKEYYKNGKLMFEWTIKWKRKRI